MFVLVPTPLPQPVSPGHSFESDCLGYLLAHSSSALTGLMWMELRSILEVWFKGFQSTPLANAFFCGQMLYGLAQAAGGSMHGASYCGRFRALSPATAVASFPHESYPVPPIFGPVRLSTEPTRPPLPRGFPRSPPMVIVPRVECDLSFWYGNQNEYFWWLQLLLRLRHGTTKHLCCCSSYSYLTTTH